MSGGDPDDVVHSVTVNSAHRGGVDLVLVHGFANGGGCFFKQVGDLGAVGRAHLVDWRGAGMSGRPKGGFSPKTEAEAIDYFVEGLEAWRLHRLGPEGKLCLVGHSMGAIVAANYAARNPENVKHLILAGPAAVKHVDPADVRAFVRRSLLHRVFHGTATFLWNLGVTPQMTMRAAPFRWQRGVVDDYVRKRWRAREVLDEPTYEALVEYATGVLMMPGVSERALGIILRPIAAARTPIGPLVASLPESVPVTFVYGEHDWMTPRFGAEVVREMRENGRKNADIHILPDAGHYAFIDQAEAVNEIIKRAWTACG